MPDTVYGYLRSPLKYAGGKSYAIQKILDVIPIRQIKTLCSPFVGGGSIEIACSQNDIQVYAYDVFEPLVNYWQVQLSRPKELYDEVLRLRPTIRDDFYIHQNKYFDTYAQTKTDVELAAVYYLLNHYSFSGLTFSGGITTGKRNYTDAIIARCGNFQATNLHVNKLDYRDSIAKHKDDFLYLDPPYALPAGKNKLYGVDGDLHKSFNHDDLYELVATRDQWLMSYNDSEYIRNKYKDFYIQEVFWGYRMSKNKKESEILIMSHDVKDYVQAGSLFRIDQTSHKL